MDSENKLNQIRNQSLAIIFLMMLCLMVAFHLILASKGNAHDLMCKNEYGEEYKGYEINDLAFKNACLNEKTGEVKIKKDETNQKIILVK